MAQVERQKEQLRDNARQKRKNAGLFLGGSLVSFNPDDKQKKLIREADITLLEVLTFLEGVLQDGHRVSIQYQEDYDSYSVIVRDGSQPWDRATALSFWHRELEVCFRAVHYALTMVYPEFPVGVVPPTRNSPDW